MVAQDLLQEAKQLQPELLQCRRTIHRHPETGFDLQETKALVKRQLTEMGYSPQECGKCGLVALAGGKKKGRTILIRADMDALPIEEAAEVEYRSETPGRMHGCGHDMHTAMLLGAAKLLKAHEDELAGTVKLMFQPAEELFQGADDMIGAGVLENPHVDAAVMIHVVPGLPLPSGIVLVPGAGTGMASCQQYRIVVKGKGGHGAMPHLTIDPITAAAHIHVALAEIHSRELTSGTFGVITTGKFQAGVASNVIADTAVMEGTIRTGDEATEEMLMQRVKEIAESVGKAYRCEVNVDFVGHCPPNISDKEVSASAVKYMTELLGQAAVPASVAMGDSNKISGGSEDFAFISTKVPSVSMMLAVGNPENGYCYPQHHPKARFDDSKLFEGAAAYAYVAARWLEEHQD